MRRAVRYATNLILQLKQSNVWTTKSHPPVAIWCWRIIQKSRETPPIWARAVYVLTSPVSLPPFRGMLTWKFANKRTFGDRYPSSYTVKHTVICEIIGERSTLSREHFLYIVRVVCISFWTTSRLLLLLALRVLQQTDSNASLISLSNGLSTDDVHNTPGDFSCVYYWVYSRGPFSAVGASGKVSCGSTTNEVGEAAD